MAENEMTNLAGDSIDPMLTIAGLRAEIDRLIGEIQNMVTLEELTHKQEECDALRASLLEVVGALRDLVEAIGILYRVAPHESVVARARAVLAKVKA